MFTVNVGLIDRAVRILLGLGLLAWFFLDQGTGVWHYAKLIGIVAVLTGILSTCPLYSVLGISTCPVRKA
jgi:hypothetical protein